MTKKDKPVPQTYAQAGVDYSALDPIKVLAQQAAANTATNLTQHASHEITASRGESAYVWEESDAYRALVVEGLGTKNLIADAMRQVTGKTYYDQIAQDTIAMIVNDLLVVGALPTVINAYFAIGDSAWMKDEVRATDLITGWANTCNKIGATWGGGETPTLMGIVQPDTIDLGGSAVGVIRDKKHLVLGELLQDGDNIILIESSGIHANGITFIRSLANARPKMYNQKLKSGRSLGEALLAPTHLYVGLLKRMQAANINIHYMVNITGHGWRKLMRATQTFSYVIHTLPNVPEEFEFMQKLGSISTKEMYGNFNMGAGFAIYVPAEDADKVLEAAQAEGLKAYNAGHVKKGEKQVIIEPLNITFSSDSLTVR